MKTTIKTITSKDFTKDGKTTTSITVTLANDVTGYLNDKGSSSDLKQGESVDYTLEVKKNKQGKDYNLLTLNRVSSSTQEEKAPQNAPQEAPLPPEKKFIAPPHAKVDIIDMKFKSRMLICELTHKCILENKLSDAEAKLHLVAWVNEMDNLIDGIFV